MQNARSPNWRRLDRRVRAPPVGGGGVVVPVVLGQAPGNDRGQFEEVGPLPLPLLLAVDQTRLQRNQ